MDIVSFFIASAQSPKLEQPSETGFHDPAQLAQSAAVSGVAPGNERPNAALPQRLADFFFGVVRPVGHKSCGPFARTTGGP